MISKYLSLIKFSHTIFALPFACIGFILGTRLNQSEINISIFILIILCMVFARSSAMAFNRYIDLEFDAKNPRTAVREIPAGIISKKSAFIFVLLTASLFILTTYFINSICFYLSPIALLVILGYSYTKRFTSLSHMVLGVGLALAPIGSFLAVTGKFEWIPILFSISVLFWVSGFDIIYALQDEEFDRIQKLNSIPVALGKKGALKLSSFLHVFSFVAIVIAGFYGGFKILYWIGCFIFGALLIYQHLLVKPNDLSKVNVAFFTTNGIASIIFSIFVISDLYI